MVDTSGYQRIDGIKDLSFEQVENMYGSRLRVVADAELQKEQLFVGLPVGLLLFFLTSCHLIYMEFFIAREADT